MKLALQQGEAGFTELTGEPPRLDFLVLAGLRVLHGRGPEEDQEVDEGDTEEARPADSVWSGRTPRVGTAFHPEIEQFQIRHDGAQDEPVGDEDQDHADQMRGQEAPGAEPCPLDPPVQGEDHRGEKGPGHQASRLGQHQLLPGLSRQHSLENPGQGQAPEDQETESQAVPGQQKIRHAPRWWSACRPSSSTSRGLLYGIFPSCRARGYASVTSKTHRVLPPSFDSLSVALTGRPKTFSNDSFWYPTEQLQKKGSVRLLSTSGQLHSPSATATVMMPFSLSHENSVPQFFLAVAK